MSEEETQKRVRGPRKTLEQQLREKFEALCLREQRLFADRMEAIKRHDAIISEKEQVKAALSAIERAKNGPVRAESPAVCAAPAEPTPPFPRGGEA